MGYRFLFAFALIVWLAQAIFELVVHGATYNLWLYFNLVLLSLNGYIATGEKNNG